MTLDECLAACAIPAHVQLLHRFAGDLVRLLDKKGLPLPERIRLKPHSERHGVYCCRFDFGRDCFEFIVDGLVEDVEDREQVMLFVPERERAYYVPVFPGTAVAYIQRQLKASQP